MCEEGAESCAPAQLAKQVTITVNRTIGNGRHASRFESLICDCFIIFTSFENGALHSESPKLAWVTLW